MTPFRGSALTAVAAAVIVGLIIALGAGAAVAHRLTVDPPTPKIEITHVPPLLTVPGERVELRYDAYCIDPSADAEPEPACDARGTVFLRDGAGGAFERLPLHIDPAADEGRYVALVPSGIAQGTRGFSYYAVFRSETTGAEATLPAAGAAAPQRSQWLARTIEVQLGRHQFGRTAAPDARAVEARWGDGPDEVGLEPGTGAAPIGASAFDVNRSGDVSLLDEAHKSILRWRARTTAPSRLPLAIDGTLADLAIDEDGTIYVLESRGSVEGRSVLRSFRADGSPRGAVETAERASQVRIGPDGPVLLEQPSGQWMEATQDGGLRSGLAQSVSGRAGRPVPGRSEVVVLRWGNEIRASTISPLGLRRSWRVSSETAIAEVQLAEPLGTGLLLVARLYEDDRDEFVALHLGPQGLRSSLALGPADWAETAPLSRFRLAGSSLYQLGSTPAGVFVDRFDLEVK